MTSDEGLKPEGAPERSPKAGVGARREWHDVLAEGVSCGLHRIERLMRAQALRARPRRRRLSPLAYGAVVIAFAL